MISVPHLLLAHPYLSIFLVSVVSICLTQVLSSVRFKVTRSKGQPPIAPYAIPLVHHAFGIVSRGPSKFFTDMMNKYGNRAPFLVMAGPIKFAVVTDPGHIRRIFQSKDMSIKQLHIQLFKQLFSSPQEALQFYAKDQTQFPEEQRIEYARTTIPRKFLSGVHLAALSERYLTTLKRNLEASQFKEGNWMEVQDIFSFFQRLITRTSTDTLFGTRLLELYPGLITDFWAFDRDHEAFTSGTPRFMARSVYAARDRLLERLQEWDDLMSRSEGVLEDEAEWNAWGSKFMRVRQRAFMKMEGMGGEGRASESLGVLQGLNSNLLPSVFWTVFEVLRDADLKRRVIMELNTHLFENSDRLDITKLAAIPLFQAIYAEVLRLRVATATARTAEGGNIQLDDKYLLRKGTNAMVFNHPLALNHTLWEKVRPDAVAKPLDQFWAERFLTREGRFTVEGTSGCLVPFGGGAHLCPGRHFAKHMAISTLALLLGEYEVQLVDPELVDEALPEEIGLAFGVIAPTNEIPVRIRKRKD